MHKFELKLMLLELAVMLQRVHIVFIILTIFTSSQAVTKNEEVDYYVDLISEANKTAFTYEWPTSAKEYLSSGKRKKYGKYDFVIIGGGSSGSAVIKSLSEVSNWTVLVLEAGKQGDNFSDILGMFGPIEFSHFNWAFNTTPQKTCCQGMVDHRCTFARGKGLGGSSLISVAASIRGFKNDYDQWAKLVQNKRWGFKSVLNYFKRIENFVHSNPEAPFDPEYHGTNGPLRVDFHYPNSPQLEAFFEANKELGFNIVDYNANQMGVGPVQFHTVNGKRQDDGKAFVDPIKHRKNLKILTESYVTKIRIKKSVATGVEFSRNGRNYFVEANKEVILCAGVFGSPQILMLSGIGPKRHLEEVKIKLVKNLEVGSSLFDHAAFIGTFIETNYTEPVTSLKKEVEDYLKGVGPLTIAFNGQGIGYYESSDTRHTGTPDIELTMAPARIVDPLLQRMYGLTDQTYNDVFKNVDPARTFFIIVVTQHTKSKGTVRLKSNNPFDYPLIDSNHLSDPDNRDMETLYEGIEIVQKLLKTRAMKAMNARLAGGPLQACKHHKYLSKQYWFCALRQLTTVFHQPVGTCSMGTDPKEGAVVDSELKVFGVKNLRIADASVIPLTFAGHTHTAIVMVGEQLGDLVKDEYIK